MQPKIRLSLVLFLTVVLLASAVMPVSAADETTVSGTCWLLDEPESPDVRDWFNGKDDLNYHVRNEKQIAFCDFDDPRLDGYLLLTVNWDVKFDWDSPYWITGHDHGYMDFFDMDGNMTWQGKYNSHIDEFSQVTGYYVLQGVGENERLMAKLSAAFSFTGEPDWALHITGTIK